MAAKRKTTRVTLSTVAAHAGVALSTASIILAENSEYFRNFSPTTIRRVRRSAEKLGYKANLFASGLSAKSSSLFFVVALRDIRRSSSVEKYLWAFDGDLLGGVIDVAVRSGVYPIIAMTKPEASEAETRNLERVLGGGVFGAIVRTPDPALEDTLRQRIQQGHPTVVTFPNSISTWSSNAVDIDNAELGREAGRLLAKQKCKRWLFIRDSEECEAHDNRFRGFEYVARLAHAKIEIISTPRTMNALATSDPIAAHMKRSRPEGAFAASFGNSDAFLRACRKLQIAAGKDVFLVGCDCSMIPEAAHPAITSLEASWRDTGVVAMEQLLEMRNNHVSSFANILVRHQIVRGETCPVD